MNGVFRRIDNINEAEPIQSNTQSIVFGNRLTSSNVSKRFPFPRYCKSLVGGQGHSNFNFTGDEGMQSTGHGVTSGKRKLSRSKRKYVDVKR